MGGGCIRGGVGAEEGTRVVECGDGGCGDWNEKSSMLTDGDEDPVVIAISTFQYRCGEPRTTLSLLIN